MPDYYTLQTPFGFPDIHFATAQYFVTGRDGVSLAFRRRLFFVHRFARPDQAGSGGTAK